MKNERRRTKNIVNNVNNENNEINGNNEIDVNNEKGRKMNRLSFDLVVGYFLGVCLPGFGKKY